MLSLFPNSVIFDAHAANVRMYSLEILNFNLNYG